MHFLGVCGNSWNQTLDDVQKEPSLPNNGNGVSSNPRKPAETYRPTWNNALNEKFAQLDVAYKLRHYNDTMEAGCEWGERK